jgi:hypothetical protein
MDPAMTLRIRERAYHIWAAQGGDAEKNWLQAETELLELTTGQASSSPIQKGRGARNRKSAVAAKVA